MYCENDTTYTDPVKFYENRYKEIKSTHPRFRVYWGDVFTTKFYIFLLECVDTDNILNTVIYLSM